MEEEAGTIQWGDEAVGQAATPISIAAKVLCKTTALAGNIPRVAVILSFSADRVNINGIKTVACFKDPEFFTDWVQNGEYIVHCSSPMDYPFYFTLN